MKSKAKRMLAIMLALLLALPAMASAEGDDALVIPPELNEGLEGLDGPPGICRWTRWPWRGSTSPGI